jgi:hypothetical protein
MRTLVCAALAIPHRSCQRKDTTLLGRDGDAHLSGAKCPHLAEADSPSQSTLVPVVLTTLPHFSVSSAISFPNSTGDPGSTAPP